MKTTVEKLNKKMQESLEQGYQLHLQPINLKTQRWNSKFLWETSHYKMVGDDDIELQKLSLIAMLTDKQSGSGGQNDDQSTSSHIVVIVGGRGTGKTTLAQRVVDDHHTRNAFSTILWVHGSEDFTPVELLSAIATAAGIKAGGVGSGDKMEEMLASKLEGKRVLLVLDDVWTKQVHERYLETCLPVQHGSRILMTARDRSVAVHVKSAHTHNVKELDVTDCRSLLSSSSCLGAQQQLDNSLMEIGRTLIEKCSRVPLAIKVIGGVLRTKDPTYEEWRKVSECEGWSTDGMPHDMKDIAGPIRVAYNDLPSQLKQCFLYCLHLPEGFVISKLTVTRLWISEGFVAEPQEGCISPEDTAEEYYNELLLRNLLQPKVKVGSAEDEMERCTLHDCVRSVMRFVTKDLWTGGKSSSMISTQGKFKTALPRPCFRTLILHKHPSGDRVLDGLSKSVKYLRVVDLAGTGIRHVPGSVLVEPLLHLRFLNLSHTDITELPESIGSLRDLQFLLLQHCYRLHSLPDGVSKLENLRTLDLEGTAPRLVLPRLAGLKQLTTLHGFIVNSKEATAKDTSGWPLEDLQFLTSLRSLQIVRMERIQQPQRADAAALSSKSQLTQLEIRGSTRKPGLVSAEEEDRRRRISDDVLGKLQPPQCLESLKIVGYHGQSFPNWILHLLELRQLAITDCSSCDRLPALGQLPQLRTLTMSSCPELRVLVETCPVQAFPKLERLHLFDMRALDSWEGFEAGDLPSLAELQLQRCPSMKSLPSCLGRCRLLTRMLIVSVDSLEAVDGLASLRELVVQDSGSLASISNLPALKSLTVVDCSGLQNVTGLKRLKHLRLVDRELTSLPDWLTTWQWHGSVPAETLTVVGREVLLGSLEDWPAISGIGKVYGNLPEGSPFFTNTGTDAAGGGNGKTAGSMLMQIGGLPWKWRRSWSWWWSLANSVRKAIQTRMPATRTKRRYLLLAILALPLAGTNYLVPFLQHSRYIGPFPIAVFLVFLAYMAMLTVFLLTLNN